MASSIHRTITERTLPISEETWLLHKTKIWSLYIDNAMTLDDVMKTMRTEEDFCPTKRQYTLQLNKWKFYKKQSWCRSQPVQPSSSEDVTSPIIPTPYIFPVQPPPAEPIQATQALAGVSTEQTHEMTRTKNENNIPRSTQPYNTDERLCGGEMSSLKRDYDLVTSCFGTDDMLFDISQSRMPDMPVNDHLFTIEEELPATVLFDFHDIMTPDTMTVSIPSLYERTESEVNSQMENGGSADNARLPQFAISSSEPHFPQQTPSEEDFFTRFVPNLGTRPECSSYYALEEILAPGYGGITKPAEPLEYCLPLSVTEFSRILNFRGIHSVEHKLLPQDLEELQRIAQLLSAAGSYEDAFSLNYLIFLQMLTPPNPHPNSSLIPPLAELCRNAKTSAGKRILQDLVRSRLFDRIGLDPPKTLDACLLHSYLGNNYLAFVPKDLQAAEYHCCLALREARNLSRIGKIDCRLAYETILVGNLVQTLTQKGTSNARFDVEAAYFSERLVNTLLEVIADHLVDMTALDQVVIFRPSVNADESIRRILEWCTTMLADDHSWYFDKFLQNCSKDAVEVAGLDSTVLFCYLWSQWEHEQLTSVYQARTCHCHANLIRIETICGIRPTDTLSAISTIISPGPSHGARQHKTLAERALQNCREFLDARSQSITKVFLDVHAAILRDPCPVTPDSKENGTSPLAHEFVRRFISSHVTIRLSENAFPGAKPRPMPGRASFSPSVTPTMISTPRSSWSGFRSFKSVGRRSATHLLGKSTEALSLSMDSVRRSISTSSSFRPFSRNSSIMSLDAIADDVDATMSD